MRDRAGASPGAWGTMVIQVKGEADEGFENAEDPPVEERFQGHLT